MESVSFRGTSFDYDRETEYRIRAARLTPRELHVTFEDEHGDEASLSAVSDNGISYTGKWGYPRHGMNDLGEVVLDVFRSKDKRAVLYGSFQDRKRGTVVGWLIVLNPNEATT